MTSEKPVWLFSDGPTETGNHAALLNGQRYPKRLRSQVAAVKPRDVALFGGKVDADKLDLEDWLINPALRDGSSDFRNWQEIGAWAEGIAGTLQAQAAHTPTNS